MDLPIPTHLQGYFTPARGSNEYETEGTIRCTCGSGTFSVKESNGRQIVEGICAGCGKEILLFDIGKHGWNGFVCHEDFLVDRSLPLQKQHCPEFGAHVFHISMSIFSQGKQDFLEECVAFDSNFSPEDWVDGFECISIFLECASCGCALEEWGPFETM